MELKRKLQVGLSIAQTYGEIPDSGDSWSMEDYYKHYSVQNANMQTTFDEFKTVVLEFPNYYADDFFYRISVEYFKN